ncbi:hypothetical protein pCPXV0007 [Cowpox virus]|uniref:Uncharacterized protein n=1 Tax=Cowpox virus TaxID=10243 RepID=A0A1B5FM11_COWPX|nr:hypothetical protein pCPXV0007 [Cowpox virus]SNB49146.1 hypothetical protein pCPXV0007 [Cowpox virus]SNB50688.1 hypothetical protein pCPXV0007 [Cowpox virus]SNB51873.1 hypothetical protein pCPXV0007 [Cowpox virus]SNB53209.1 hypothetical protein pCPXV0007 [Cowpox virus]
MSTPDAILLGVFLTVLYNGSGLGEPRPFVIALPYFCLYSATTSSISSKSLLLDDDVLPRLAPPYFCLYSATTSSISSKSLLLDDCVLLTRLPYLSLYSLTTVCISSKSLSLSLGKRVRLIVL